jgi:hypothetical protein
MIPIGESNNSFVWKKSQPGEWVLPDVILTIVYVVQVLLGIIWIIDNQSSTQPITVLGLVVAVIPECPLNKRCSEFVESFDMNKGKYRLVLDRKFIRKAFVWYDGTLGDTSRTIDVVGTILRDAMPVL